MGEFNLDNFIQSTEIEAMEPVKTEVATPEPFDIDGFISNTKMEEPAPMEGLYDIPEFKQSAGSKMDYLSDTAQGAMRELRDFGSLAKTGTRIAAGAMFLSPEDHRKIAVDLTDQVVTALKENPKLPIDIAKSIMIDTMASYGQKPGDFTINPTVFLPRIAEKFKDAPIETALDLSVIGGIAKFTVKGLSKLALKKSKNIVKGTLSKNARRLKVINDDMKTPVKKAIDDLFDNSEVINIMPIEKLDSVYTLQESGINFAKDISKLERAEAMAANQAIDVIKKQPIDKDTLRRTLLVKMRNDGFVDELGEVVPELVNAQTKAQLNLLKSDRPLNVGQLKANLDVIDDKINWTNTKSLDDGLKLIRKEYRNKLGELSPAYNEIQLRRHDFLNMFSNKLKKLKETGGGEKLAKNFFSTEEELTQFTRILKENPNIVSADALGRFQEIRAWHSWNNYFKQNKKYLPSFIWVDRAMPISTEIFNPIKKGYRKTQIRAHELGIKSPTKILKDYAEVDLSSVL